MSIWTVGSMNEVFPFARTDKPLTHTVLEKEFTTNYVSVVRIIKFLTPHFLKLSVSNAPFDMMQV